MIPYIQLSLADIFTDCQNKFNEDKPAFLSLLESHIDLDEIVPDSFWNHFYASTGRTRKYSLTSMLWALILQRIFSIPTDSLLLIFLNYSTKQKSRNSRELDIYLGQMFKFRFVDYSKSTNGRVCRPTAITNCTAIGRQGCLSGIRKQFYRVLREAEDGQNRL